MRDLLDCLIAGAMRDRLIYLIEHTVFLADRGRIAEQIADNLIANDVVILGYNENCDLECPLGGECVRREE